MTVRHSALLCVLLAVCCSGLACDATPNNVLRLRARSNCAAPAPPFLRRSTKSGWRNTRDGILRCS